MKYVPIGKDDFKKIIDGKYYYVDKSMLIKDSELGVQQIQEKRYGEELVKKGYKKYKGYSISFYKKQCFISQYEK